MIVSPRLKMFSHFKFDDYFAKRYRILRREDILPFETLGKVSLESDKRYVERSEYLVNSLNMIQESKRIKNKREKSSLVTYYATSTVQPFGNLKISLEERITGKDVDDLMDIGIVFHLALSMADK
ncbi:hypothetical protein BGX26_002587 [Mortierella sp. AD094]|nr:hypothetical protein BGX26_002587 [Mortierella sp. AD094]